MRNKFPGYYNPSESDFKKLWSEGIFIFDTNVLLDLYRYSEETVENLISTMEGLKDRIWIPYRVAFEYHRRLNDIIREQAAAYNDAIEMLSSFNKKFQEKRKHPFLKNILHQEIEEFTKKFDLELKEKQKLIFELIIQNPTKEKLADIIDNAVGNPFSETELDSIYQEGAKRYQAKVPPGYKDKGEKLGNEIYGDLIIWKEICRKALELDKPIILVTGDVKEDWFQIVMGRTVGPRPELIEEIKKQKDILFYIYSTDVFLRRAKEDLSIEIKDGTLTEIEDVIKESRKFQEKLNSDENSLYKDSIEPNSNDSFETYITKLFSTSDSNCSNSEINDNNSTNP